MEANYKLILDKLVELNRKLDERAAKWERRFSDVGRNLDAASTDTASSDPDANGNRLTSTVPVGVEISGIESARQERDAEADRRVGMLEGVAAAVPGTHSRIFVGSSSSTPMKGNRDAVVVPDNWEGLFDQSTHTTEERDLDLSADQIRDNTGLVPASDPSSFELLDVAAADAGSPCSSTTTPVPSSATVSDDVLALVVTKSGLPDPVGRLMPASDPSSFELLDVAAADAGSPCLALVVEGGSTRVDVTLILVVPSPQPLATPPLRVNMGSDLREHASAVTGLDPASFAFLAPNTSTTAFVTRALCASTLDRSLLHLHDNAIRGPIPASLGFLPDLRGNDFPDSLSYGRLDSCYVDERRPRLRFDGYDGSLDDNPESGFANPDAPLDRAAGRIGQSLAVAAALLDRSGSVEYVFCSAPFDSYVESYVRLQLVLDGEIPPGLDVLPASTNSMHLDVDAAAVSAAGGGRLAWSVPAALVQTTCSMVCLTIATMWSLGEENKHTAAELEPCPAPSDAFTVTSTDRLSFLPDMVLSNIVSRLPLKEAARTVVLSRRWWTRWRAVRATSSVSLLGAQRIFLVVPLKPDRVQDLNARHGSNRCMLVGGIMQQHHYDFELDDLSLPHCVCLGPAAAAFHDDAVGAAGGGRLVEVVAAWSAQATCSTKCVAGVRSFTVVPRAMTGGLIFYHTADMGALSVANLLDGLVSTDPTPFSTLGNLKAVSHPRARPSRARLRQPNGRIASHLRGKPALDSASHLLVFFYLSVAFLLSSEKTVHSMDLFCRLALVAVLLLVQAARCILGGDRPCAGASAREIQTRLGGKPYFKGWET